MQVFTFIFDLVWLLSILGFLAYIAVAGSAYLRTLNDTFKESTRASQDSIRHVIETAERVLELREYIATTPTQPRLPIVRLSPESESEPTE